jgi:hypothetical protein
MESQLWQRLGLRREDLAHRPHREVEEYCTYIELICQREAAQMRAGGVSGTRG